MPRNALRAIAPDAVPAVFNATCIERLVKIGRLPATADKQRFTDSVREAARIYATEARKSSVTDIRKEIERLHRAAMQACVAKTADACAAAAARVADLVEKMSPKVREIFAARAMTPGFAGAPEHDIPAIIFPTVAHLRDPETGPHAADIVRRYCSGGGQYGEGRTRSSGRRSTSWQPVLYAPTPPERPLRLEAERQFIMHIRLAWLEATGEKPVKTVNPSRPDGPFANLARECLRLVGAGHVDAVQVINSLHQRWKALSLPKS